MSDLQEWCLPLGYAYTCVMGFASGTFVAGTVVIIWHRRRGQRDCPRLPGHWLLLLGFAAVLANGVALDYDVVQ